MTAYCVRLYKCLENNIIITIEMSYRNDLFTALNCIISYEYKILCRPRSIIDCRHKPTPRNNEPITYNIVLSNAEATIILCARGKTIVIVYHKIQTISAKLSTVISKKKYNIMFE